MKTAIVYSTCECEARLGAELDENRVVLRGWARYSRRPHEELAPASALGPERARFDIGWSCPFCTRNVLRSFEAETLSFREAPSAS